MIESAAYIKTLIGISKVLLHRTLSHFGGFLPVVTDYWN